jgi:hypothetical protein
MSPAQQSRMVRFRQNAPGQSQCFYAGCSPATILFKHLRLWRDNSGAPKHLLASLPTSVAFGIVAVFTDTRRIE